VPTGTIRPFSSAIAAVFPHTQVRAWIVHPVPNALDFVSSKDRRAVAAALKEVYRARDAEAGRAALDAFADGPWGRKDPAIAAAWRRHWPEVIPFFAVPAEVRRIIDTTNAIEALHAKLRRKVRTRGHFPHDDAALKLLFLALNRAAREWRMPAGEWTAAKAQVAILFHDRVTP
jgi:putative transposase